MKRIIVLCCIVLLAVSIMVIPAGAANVYDAHIIEFDEVSASTSRAPLTAADRVPFYVGYTENGQFQTYIYDSPSGYLTWSPEDSGDIVTSSSCTSDYVFPIYHEKRYYTFYQDDIVVHKSRITNGRMKITFMSGIDTYPEWTVSGRIVTMEQLNGTWGEVSYPFTYSQSGTNQNSIDLCEIIRNQLPTVMNDKPLLRICDLKLSVYCGQPYTQLKLRFLSQNNYTAYPYLTIGDWLEEWDLDYTVVDYVPSDPSGTDFTSWIGVALTGFLRTELFPGVSIDSMLYFVLSLCLVMVFLKVFH